ncbi:MAG: hypothetical protein GY791_21200 [Alphaproteobacteria bacterium]|nr:hypothetical protein [Alphaproteobacteria bacterium]
MIFLHHGDDAADRVDRIVKAAGGDAYVGDPSRDLPAYIDEVADWLATAGRPRIIVVNPARATTNDHRQALRALRRMAKFKGVDVHLVGGEEVTPIADHVIAGDDDSPDISPAADAARLLHDEVLEPFRRTVMDIPDWREVAAASGCSEDEARAKVRWMEGLEVWVNNLYQVNVEEMGDGRVTHLIIRRLDRQPIHSWPHFQAIKNEILGPECEAVELYPPESHLVDEKDHYHLWGFRRAEDSFGVGFRTGRQVREGD